MQQTIIIEGVVAGAVGFVPAGSSLPVIRELVISNPTEDEFAGLSVNISALPGFALPWSARIDLLPASGRALLPVDFSLLSEYFVCLDETIPGEIEVTVTHADQVVGRKVFPLTLLAYGSWSGLGLLPHTLACHVIPGHPLIHKFVTAAQRMLAALPEKRALCGYDDLDGIRMQLGALFAAIAQESIALSGREPDYRTIGQPLRPPDALLAVKTASALELALFYASCLEAARLNPLLVFVGGKVLVGCWTQDKRFPEATMDDSHLLAPRLRGENPEILLIDLSAISRGGGAPFAAAENLPLESGDLFVLDIASARREGVLPLPGRKQLPDGGYACLPAQPMRESVPPISDYEHPVLEQWERELLRLSSANTLLNMRMDASLQIQPGQLTRFFEIMLDGGDFSLCPAPDSFKAELRGDGTYRPAHSTQLEELALASCKGQRLYSFLDSGRTRQIATTLFRLSSGAADKRMRPTIYLGVGFLRWFESESAQQPRLAPLVLLPGALYPDGADDYRLKISGRPVINHALVELMRQRFGADINLSGVLHPDRQGPGFQTIFNAFRQVILGRKGWSVKECAFLSLFDPARTALWDDLRARSPEFGSSPVAWSLLTGSAGEDVFPQGFPAPDELDSRYLPCDLCVPLSADASQQLAVCAAGEGGSFILCGAAGTGKTQTVVNITANMLSRGKRVLILSGSKTALVQAREMLDGIGAGPFCLSALDDAADDIRPALERVTSLGRIAHPADYRAMAEKLGVFRDDLDAHRNALHKKHSCGFSLYEAISIYLQNADAPDGVDIPAELPDLLSEANHRIWTDIVAGLAQAARACGSVANHPLSAFRNAKFSPSLIVGITATWRDYRAALGTLEQETDQLRWLLTLPAFSRKDKYIAAVDLCKFLLNCPPIPAHLYAHDDLHGLGERLDHVCELGKSRDELETELLESFHPDILTFDEESARDAWEKANDTWALPRAAAQKKVLAALGELYRKPTSLLSKESVPALLDKITLYKARRGEFERAAPLFSELFGPLWSGGKPDFDRLGKVYRLTLTLDGLLADVCGNGSARKKTDIALATGFFHNLASFRERHSQAMERFMAAWEVIPPLEVTLSKQMRGGFTQFTGAADWLAEMREMTGCWLSSQNQLRDWCNYLAVREAAQQSGIATVATALESGALPEDSDLLGAFHKALFAEICERMVGDDPLLKTFSAQAMEGDILLFASLSETFEQLTFRELAATLSARAADAMNKATLSEQAASLRQELEGSAPLSAEALMAGAPELLPELFPCMLMSPSAAAALVPKGSAYPPFDLVIIEEAALLPTCEAVGALAMGRSAILTDDPAQCAPPGGWLDGDVCRSEDFTSILDSFRQLGAPRVHLSTHYRSRHESLFSFPGSRFYAGQPRIFPSPMTASRVKLTHVGGVYSPTLRQNEAEAEKIAADAAARLLDKNGDTRSMGIVALLPAQRDLIQQKLDGIIRQNSALAAAIKELDHPLFVECASDLQGGEADLILLSVAFGPDTDGVLPTTFGPLGSVLGEKYLCLALTRARKELLVYASIRPEQIDTANISGEGVASLRAFLGYAAQPDGSPPLHPLPTPENIGALERAVADFIQSLGYKVRRAAGCSMLRVDVAARHPKQTERYMLGILCDGEGYHAASTARERLILQERMLRSRGWRIHRVWSLDFLSNREKELRRLQQALTQALEYPCEEKEELPPAIRIEDFPREERLPQSAPPVPESGPFPQVKPRTEAQAANRSDAEPITEPQADAQPAPETEAESEAEHLSEADSDAASTEPQPDAELLSQADADEAPWPEPAPEESGELPPAPVGGRTGKEEN